MRYTYLHQGLVEGVRGPTVLDLSDHFGSTVQALSILFVWCTVGSCLGSLTCRYAMHGVGCQCQCSTCLLLAQFSVGYLVDKFPAYKWRLISSAVLIFGVSAAVVAASNNIYVFYAVNFISGVGGGGMETTGNVACLALWRDRNDGGPFMHCIHFGFALGTIIGPLLAAPFLSTSNDILSPEPNERANFTPTGEAHNSMTLESAVVLLYELVGCLCLVAGIGIFVKAFEESCCKSSGQTRVGEKEDTMERRQRITLTSLAFIFFMFLFFFLYSGLEVGLGTYIPTFAVKSRLGSTRSEGAYAMAAFWGAFCAGRFASIFVAALVSPLNTMLASFALCITSSVCMIFLSQTSLVALQVLSAIAGVGMSPMYATGMLWAERHLTMTNRIGSALSFAAMAGANVVPIFVGSFIVETPLFLMITSAALFGLIVVAFCGASLVGRGLKKGVVIREGTQNN